MRYLLYSHDSYGLGHFRRSLLIAQTLVAAHPENEVLLVTGASRAHSYVLGERIDMVRVPAATKAVDGAYRSRSLGLDLAELVQLRRSLVAAALDAYRPDVVLVDHAPLGLANELEPLVATRGARWVLGLREIIDTAGSVEDQWRASGAWDAIARYDGVLVYGDPRVPSTAHELQLAARTGVDVFHVGYLGRPELDQVTRPDGRVLVCGGGGGDAHALVSAYLDYVESSAPDHRSLVVTGPLMSTRRISSLRARAVRLRVALVEFSDHLDRLIARASAVVSMAGYNTVVEVMAAGVPTLLVPRCRPRAEQWLRAQRVAPHANVVVAHPERLTGDTIAAFVDANLGSARVRAGLDLAGLHRVAATLSPSLEVSYV